MSLVRAKCQKSKNSVEIEYYKCEKELKIKTAELSKELKYVEIPLEKEVIEEADVIMQKVRIDKKNIGF